MKSITLPPESADYNKAAHIKQEGDAFAMEAAAKVQRISSPNYVDEEDAAHNEMIKRGEIPLSRRKTVATKIAEAVDQYADAKEIQRVRNQIFEAEKVKEEKRVREAMLPVVEAEERKISESLSQIFSSLRVIEHVKGKLVGRGFGHWGLPCRLDVDRVFKDGVHFASDLAQLLRQAAALNYIKLPEELR